MVPFTNKLKQKCSKIPPKKNNFVRIIFCRPVIVRITCCTFLLLFFFMGSLASGERRGEKRPYIQPPKKTGPPPLPLLPLTHFWRQTVLFFSLESSGGIERVCCRASCTEPTPPPPAQQSLVNHLTHVAITRCVCV